MQQILKLDAKENSLETNIWLSIKWKDEYLAWDEGIGINDIKFSKISSTRLPPSAIWTPDIEVYNILEQKFVARSNLVVVNSGRFSNKIQKIF